MATTPFFNTLETWTRDVSTEINSPDLRIIGITLSKSVIPFTNSTLDKLKSSTNREADITE
ncbi:hypothetical protein SDC9_150637 [bioreactor metagenome]|uniref:Uncharacterized protein n=1 Tax=bioreactor metagenome TaxID=1076179 RepID=A0A645ENL8_9ZZZZ